MKKFLSYILALTQLLNAFAYAEGPTKNEFQKAEALRLLLLFNKAGSLYKEKGPDAWVSNFDFLEDSEINFVKQTLSKLVALPSLSFDESNNTFYLSLDNSKTSLSLTDKENVFLLNSEKFTINSSENIEALYQRLILILSPKKSAYFNVFSFLPSAHAISGLAVTGIAIAGALLLACLFKIDAKIKVGSVIAYLKEHGYDGKPDAVAP
jgi:hypothetical protein